MSSPDDGRAGDDAVVAVSGDDFLWFVDLALDEMVSILRHLGDDRANRRPDLEGANSPFAILTHCLGVMAFWGGFMVGGRTIERDRAAEFVADGEVEDLVQRAAAARAQLAVDMRRVDSMSAPPDILGPQDAGTPYARTRGGVLLHILEELLQHLGQMQISRDVLMAEG